MSKIEDMSMEEMMDTPIKIERSEEFVRMADTLGDFIGSLSLGTSTNNRLVELIISQIQEAERTAFCQGFRWGMDFMQYDQSHAGAEDRTTTLLS